MSLIMVGMFMACASLLSLSTFESMCLGYKFNWLWFGLNPNCFVVVGYYSCDRIQLMEM
jgi:hypothetical protein